MKKISLNGISENRNNLLGMRVFMDAIGLFDQDARFEELCDIFDKERKSNSVKLVLRLWAENAQRQQKAGKKYEDFEFETSDGKTQKLSDYVGKSKYIYFDFWASWCDPCIAEMPRLKEIYEKYKDLGFEIISISLDTDKKSWLKALSRLDTTWVHLNNFETVNRIKGSYLISTVPHGVLLDKEGVIIETNSNMVPVLDKKLEELLR